MIQKIAGCLAFGCLMLLSANLFGQGVATLNGSWHVSRGVMNGENVPDDVLASMTFKVTDGEFTAQSGGLNSNGKLEIGDAADQLKVTIGKGADAGRSLNAKWRMESGQLTIAYAQDSVPTDFNSTAGSNILVLYYAAGARPASSTATASRSTTQGQEGGASSRGNDKAMMLD